MTKRTNIILGDGISGYVIAACLDYLGEEFEIYGNGKYKAPDILLLKTNLKYEFNEGICGYDSKAELYYKIFNIIDKDKYLRNVTIGYMDDEGIMYNPTKKMLKNYYKKQNRKMTSSSMSDSKTSFVAIDLKKVYRDLVHKYHNNFIQTEITRDTLEELKETNNINIYNTIFETTKNNNEPTYEYICREDNNVQDYVYDCRKNSDVKRYTSKYTEYFKKPKNKKTIKVKNYYGEAEIYKTSSYKHNNTLYDISRNATKTQLKIEDIIEYLMENGGKKKDEK